MEIQLLISEIEKLQNQTGFEAPFCAGWKDAVSDHINCFTTDVEICDDPESAISVSDHYIDKADLIKILY